LKIINSLQSIEIENCPLPSRQHIVSRQQTLHKTTGPEVLKNQQFQNWCIDNMCYNKQMFDLITNLSSVIVIQHWSTGFVFSSKKLLLSINGKIVVISSSEYII